MKGNMRDPYRNWKLLSIVLAVGVLAASAAAIVFPANIVLIGIALVLGAVMCGSSGMMAFSKERRLLGYICSVLTGGLLVLLVIWTARILLW